MDETPQPPTPSEPPAVAPPESESPTSAPSQSRLPAFLHGRKGIIAVVAAVVLLGIIGFAVSKGGSHTIEGSISLATKLGDGTISLDDYENPEEGDECAGMGGYDDMSPGTDVTVKDEDGTLLATGSLEQGTLTDVEDGVFFICELPFTVEDVPDAKFYSIETGGRGGLNFSKAEMEEKNWRVEFSLGP